MRNRAKCKLCKSIIESFHSTDFCRCSCGEIAVDGGKAMRCSARNFDNFMRVDDNDNEIVVKVIEKDQNITLPKEDLSKKDLLNMLDEMIESYERLPEVAKSSFVTNYDLLSFMLLVSSILRSDFDKP